LTVADSATVFLFGHGAAMVAPVLPPVSIHTTCA
jgi:hypothetical protein